MALEGSASTIIEAPIHEVFRVAADVESSPRWQPDIKVARCVERDADGRQLLVHTETDAKVRTLNADLRFSYDEPAGLSWVQERGDLKAIRGSWSFEALGDGRTKATYTSTVEFGRMLDMVIRGPVIGTLRRQLIDSMPGRLKSDIERHR